MLRALLELLSLLVLLLGSLPIALFWASRSPVLSSEASVARVLILAVTWCFSETALALILASLGLFNLKFALLFHALLFIVGLLLLRFNKGAAPLSIKGLEVFPKSKTVLALLCVFFIGQAFHLWNLLVWPTVEADTLGYHLPLLAKLVQTGKISFLNNFWFQEHFPRNWEMVCALFALPTKNDMLLFCPNLLAQSILGLSIIGLGLKAGVSGARSVAAAFLMISMPIVSNHLTGLNVDIPFAAFVLSAFYFSFAFAHSKSWTDFTLILMSTALYLGIKSTGALYFGVNVLLLLVLLFRKAPWPKASLISTAKLGLFFSPLLLLPGIFWYAYNWIFFGNPLVGVHITLFGKTIFPGQYSVSGLAQSSLLKVFDPWSRHDLRILGDQISLQLSYAFYALLFFSVIFMGPLIFKAKGFLKPSLWSNSQTNPHSKLQVSLFALMSMAFFIYLKTPFSGNYNASLDGLTEFVGQAFRFGFPFLGLLAVLAALGMERLKVKEWVLLVLVLMLQLCSFHFQWKIMAVLLLAFAFTLLIRFRAVLVFAPMLILGFVVSFFLFFANEARTKNLAKRSYGSLVSFIDSELKDYGKIGFLISTESYNFCGSRFAHEVEYIPWVNAPVKPSDFSTWIKSIQNQGIEILAIGPASADTLKNIRQQLSLFPESLKPIFGTSENSATTLYKVGSPVVNPFVYQACRTNRFDRRPSGMPCPKFSMLSN